MAQDAPEQSLPSAQLERVQLENDKLRLELAALRKGKPWYHLPTQIVPIVTALVAIGGFWWASFSTGTSKRRTGLSRRSNPTASRSSRSGNS